MTPEEAIAILWDYHHVKQELRPAELIFILGSNDIRVAEYAAELYARKLAPLLLFSGGMGRLQGMGRTGSRTFRRGGYEKGSAGRLHSH